MIDQRRTRMIGFRRCSLVDARSVMNGRSRTTHGVRASVCVLVRVVGVGVGVWTMAVTVVMVAVEVVAAVVVDG